jgi:hypothetical protein
MCFCPWGVSFPKRNMEAITVSIGKLGLRGLSEGKVFSPGRAEVKSVGQ